MTARAPVDRLALWIGGGFAVLGLMLLMGLGLAGWQRAAGDRVVHTLDVERRLTTVLVSLQDAETGSRGFLVTGQDAFLQPYRSASARLDAELTGLADATADNPRQQTAMIRLRSAAAAKMANVALVIALRSHAPTTTNTLRTLLAGKAIMDGLRGQIASMEAEEARLFAVRQSRSDTAFAWVCLLDALGLALVAGMAVTALRGNARRLALITARLDELAVSNAELSSGVRRSEDAEAQVRQLQKMEAVGQLTGGIAHDFNNMLAIVIGSLDLARRRLTSDPVKADALIANALEGAQRAALLTARLLAFSRLQALAPVAMDPNRLMVGVAELLRRTIGERVHVETVLAGGLWRVRADPSQLENCIINLCVNGRDAMPDGGPLTIETANAHLDETYARLNVDVTPGQYVLISVTDSGAGMTPDVIQRAFDPFFTTKAVGKGTGLGLSQVFGFVKQSGGHVKVYSEPGVGTSVKVYLPRWTGKDTVDDRHVVSADLSPALCSELILVVEDDPDVQRISVEALRFLGYTVMHANSAEEALRVIAKEPRIDLLFTDIVMPGDTGRVLADKTLAQRPEIRVLYTTGYTRNAVVHNGILDAGVALLPKPFTVEQLAGKVREVLDAPRRA